MQKISEAILDKVKGEAREIVEDAEAKARERVGKAEQQHQVKFEEEKKKLMEAAESEAARIRSRASMSAREELLNVKNDIINDIIKDIKKALAGSPESDELALKMVREAVEAAGVEKARVYASKNNVAGLEKLIKADKKLSGKITEVIEYKCDGGALVEDIEGTIRIDNTFETRLDMLMSRVLPEINRELFGE